jgi:hypothetical protein
MWSSLGSGTYLIKIFICIKIKRKLHQTKTTGNCVHSLFIHAGRQSHKVT